MRVKISCEQGKLSSSITVKRMPAICCDRLTRSVMMQALVSSALDGIICGFDNNAHRMGMVILRWLSMSSGGLLRGIKVNQNGEFAASG